MEGVRTSERASILYLHVSAHIVLSLGTNIWEVLRLSLAHGLVCHSIPQLYRHYQAFRILSQRESEKPSVAVDWFIVLVEYSCV